MTTEGNFPPRQLCLKPSLYGRFSLDHLWPLLRDHRGAGQSIWARGYFVSTVGRDEATIREYIRNQEREDDRLDQLNLWK